MKLKVVGIIRKYLNNIDKLMEDFVDLQKPPKNLSKNEFKDFYLNQIKSSLIVQDVTTLQNFIYAIYLVFITEKDVKESGFTDTELQRINDIVEHQSTNFVVGSEGVKYRDKQFEGRVESQALLNLDKYYNLYLNESKSS